MSFTDLKRKSSDAEASSRKKKETDLFTVEGIARGNPSRKASHSHGQMDLGSALYTGIAESEWAPTMAGWLQMGTQENTYAGGYAVQTLKFPAISRGMNTWVTDKEVDYIFVQKEFVAGKSRIVVWACEAKREAYRDRLLDQCRMTVASMVKHIEANYVGEYTLHVCGVVVSPTQAQKVVGVWPFAVSILDTRLMRVEVPPSWAVFIDLVKVRGTNILYQDRDVFLAWVPEDRKDLIGLLHELRANRASRVLLKGRGHGVTWRSHGDYILVTPGEVCPFLAKGYRLAWPSMSAGAACTLLWQRVGDRESFLNSLFWHTGNMVNDVFSLGKLSATTTPQPPADALIAESIFIEECRSKNWTQLDSVEKFEGEIPFLAVKQTKIQENFVNTQKALATAVREMQVGELATICRYSSADQDNLAAVLTKELTQSGISWVEALIAYCSTYVEVSFGECSPEIKQAISSYIHSRCPKELHAQASYAISCLIDEETYGKIPTSPEELYSALLESDYAEPVTQLRGRKAAEELVRGLRTAQNSVRRNSVWGSMIAKIPDSEKSFLSKELSGQPWWDSSVIKIWAENSP